MSIKKLLYEEILKERLKPEDALTSIRRPYSLILDSIRSTYNVGSIFRTSDAVLTSSIYLCGYTPNPQKDNISKTALGAEKSVPWDIFGSSVEAIIHSKEIGYNIIALEQTDNRKSYLDLRIKDFPAAFVIGNELNGVSNEALKHCDDSIEIPMLGHKHSLNVAVSVGVLLYKALELTTNTDTSSSFSFQKHIKK